MRERCGAPGGTRTPGLQVRSLPLYPTELRARKSANHSTAGSQPIAMLESGFASARFSRAGHPASSSGPVAQLAEQQTLNLRVVGSIPTRLTSSNVLIPHGRNLDPKESIEPIT